MASVEWFIDQIKEYDFTPPSNNEEYVIVMPKWIFDAKRDEAKEMQKQEIRDACGMALSKLLYQQAIEKQSSDELHKQQIIDAYEEGQKDSALGFYIKSGETYYKNLKSK